MAKLEGKISNHPVSSLIDLSASLSYASPRIFYLCHLKSLKFRNPWLVQLATGAKRRVSAKKEHCEIKLVGKQIKIDLNILPLGPYDVLIGMNWLE